MIVVSNATPLIGLATIQRFHLLHELFGGIHIAPSVYHEVVVMGRESGGAKREVSASSWIEVRPVKDRLAVDVLLDELDLGEAETIVLACELVPIGFLWMNVKEGVNSRNSLSRRLALLESCSRPNKWDSSQILNRT